MKKLAIILCTVMLAGIISFAGGIQAFVHASANWNITNYKVFYIGAKDGVYKTTSPALFTKTGINPLIAAELMRILNEVGFDETKTAEDFSNFAHKGDNLDFQTGAVYIRLFDRLTTSGTDAVKAFTGNDDVGARWWQAVYMGKDTVGNDILTLMMAEPYRDSPFSGTTYATSAARANLLTDFAGVLSAYPSASATIATTNIPWQVGQANSVITFEDDEDEFLNPGLNSDDKVWLPSVYETSIMPGVDDEKLVSSIDADGNLDDWNRTGLWKLNGFDRGFLPSATYGESLLRSLSTDGAFVGTLDSSDPSAIYSEGGPYQAGLRPCINIKLSAIRTAQIYAGFAAGSAAAWDAGVSTTGINGTSGKSISVFGGGLGDVVSITYFSGSRRKISGITINDIEIAIASSLSKAEWQETITGAKFRAWYANDSAQMVKVEFKDINNTNFTYNTPLFVTATTEKWTGGGGKKKFDVKTFGYVAGGIAVVLASAAVFVALKSRKSTEA